MKNKRGLSQLADIIFSLILFTILFVIIMFVMGSAKMQVHAEITAANTVFLCQNDLSSVLQFPSGDRQIKDILVEDYFEEDYSDFTSEMKILFDDLLGENSWEVRVVQGEETLNVTGIQARTKSEKCSVFVPVSCNARSANDLLEYEELLAKCNLEVQLNIGYD